MANRIHAARLGFALALNSVKTRNTIASGLQTTKPNPA